MSELTSAPEEWRAVVGREGEYEVSDLGRVRSLDRVITVPDNRWGGTRTLRLRGRVLKPGTNTHGYLFVMLGRDHERTVHRLVLEAFAGPCPEGLEALHGPGGKLDNRPQNLSWGTREKNMGPDRVRDGIDSNGDRHGMAKLTWEQVDKIRRRCPKPDGPAPKGRPRGSRNGELGIYGQLAVEYGVQVSVIRKIVFYEAWRPEYRHPAP